MKKNNKIIIFSAQHEFPSDKISPRRESLGIMQAQLFNGPPENPLNITALWYTEALGGPSIN